jgi:hypothetical protein
MIALILSLFGRRTMSPNECLFMALMDALAGIEAASAGAKDVTQGYVNSARGHLREYYRLTEGG